MFEENNNANVIVNVRDQRTRTFTNGDSWLPGIDMSAGEEIEITLEFNWQRSGITKDWSLTAWGTDGGEVTVRHSAGHDTKNFSFTPKGEMDDNWVANHVEQPRESPDAEIAFEVENDLDEFKQKLDEMLGIIEITPEHQETEPSPVVEVN